MKEKIPHHIFVRFEVLPSFVDKPPKYFNLNDADICDNINDTRYRFLISAEDENGRPYNDSKLWIYSKEHFAFYNLLKRISLGKEPLTMAILYIHNESNLFRSIALTMLTYGRKRVHFTTKIKGE